MCVRVCICICINICIRVQYLVRLWESSDLNMYMCRCVQLYLVPIPYDPNSVYMCLCLVSSKALGIEGPEYVSVWVRAIVFGANPSRTQQLLSNYPSRET